MIEGSVLYCMPLSLRLPIEKTLEALTVRYQAVTGTAVSDNRSLTRFGRLDVRTMYYLVQGLGILRTNSRREQYYQASTSEVPWYMQRYNPWSLVYYCAARRTVLLEILLE